MSTDEMYLELKAERDTLKGENHSLRMERGRLISNLQATEAARQEAATELEAERIRHQQDVDIDSDCRRDFQSRLTKAEEALRAINIIWDTETRWVSFDSPDGIHALINIGPAKGRIADKAVAGWHEHYRQAALQPVQEKGEKP